MPKEVKLDGDAAFVVVIDNPGRWYCDMWSCLVSLSCGILHPNNLGNTLLPGLTSPTSTSAILASNFYSCGRISS